jgi:AcrR family transcriptional regulator
MIDVQGGRPVVPDPRRSGGLRERKKARTRAALQAAARRLVAEHGFDNVTTEQIAAEAEVSKTTLFNYFDSKEAVLIDAPADHLAQMAALLDARPRSEAPLQGLRAAQLEALTAHNMAGLAELHDLARLAEGRPALQQCLDRRMAAFDDVIMAWVRDRYPSSHPDYAVYPALVAGAGAVAVRVTLLHWDAEGGVERAAQTLATVHNHYANSLRPATAHTRSSR